MLHLGAPCKADQPGAADLGEAELVLDGQRWRVEMEHAGIDGIGLAGPEEPVEARPSRLGHDPAAPERPPQPVTDDRPLWSAVKADLAGIAFARNLDREVRLLDRQAGDPGAQPG